MKLTKRRAIYLKCLDCCGDSWREVLLCHIFDCPLWQYRTGDHVSSTRYKKRIRAAFSKNTEEIRELQKLGLNMAFFLAEGPKQSNLIWNASAQGPSTGDDPGNSLELREGRII